ncbi:MAG: radical SAM protein [Candidatus Methanomethylophilaceae archaeon]|nr:radical SAM protein [Candidatus Methanomethylophilaceae archaeon]NLF33326.1 radical SAM protein [Thermoplasmatales archaeon]
MRQDIKVLLLDGYIDDPAALGVPPYISPMARAVAGAAMDTGADVEYITIDSIRRGRRPPEADVSVVLSGNTVPGKYLRTLPMSSKELSALTPKLFGWRMIGGSSAKGPAAAGFDFAVGTDLAAALYDGISGKEVGERLRSLDEWNRWMLLGADIVRQHPDFPHPLIAEIETFRGCHRFCTGGCSYCIEPSKGRPLMRSPEDILAEAERLRSLGVRNVRVGGQTCILSYGSDPDSEVPRPNPDAVRELFGGLSAMGFNVLHVDNANPAVISEHPHESEEVLRILASMCTPGNVLALGMETADPQVISLNNLNSTPDQVMDALRMINRIGSERGSNGMPLVLPGLNFIAGLDGETRDTYAMNLDFLRKAAAEGLMIRRINIRQVMPVRRMFDTFIDQALFRRFKESVRTEIDRMMLERIVPRGTVLRDIYTEYNDGGVTFGRQIGSYPLLVGIPYRLETGRTVDVTILDWGFRSVTGIEYPFPVNTAPMSALSALPGVGKKRAARIARERPIRDAEHLGDIMEDAAATEDLLRLVTF